MIFENVFGVEGEEDVKMEDVDTGGDDHNDGMNSLNSMLGST